MVSAGEVPGDCEGMVKITAVVLMVCDVMDGVMTNKIDKERRPDQLQSFIGARLATWSKI
ncbi:hypothetical protein E2C01_009138 [Portunus trituberculatus]|uniref:Uncharacterized protein n=1 Tax=Portunus trituberculatus TaxID=210409 RepID=A0A5B7D5B5_PORTR|nr:hypothetical protein [Portunus trituberculatus]